MVDHTITIRQVAFLILVLFVAGGVRCNAVFQSSFSSRFSLQELVQRNQSHGGLDCNVDGGAAGSIGTGGGSFGKTS
jgi:hypothetical protein